MLFFTMLSFGQIALEHTYNNAIINRVNLEYSGEKYYEFKRATNELMLYNADHTLWKTIVLPAPAPTNYTGTNLIHISEAVFNSDADLEIVFSYYNTTLPGYETKIMSENGAVLATLDNVYNASLSQIDGLSPKLIGISYNPNKSKVYAIPELTLEHAYEEGIVSRIKLENSGEKYCLTDKVNGTENIYNSNHTIWKTISLPIPSGANYLDNILLSEAIIPSDNLLEIGYNYYKVIDNVYYTLGGKIINENGAELLFVPTATAFSLSVLDGCETKLIATLRLPSSASCSNVYQIPSLTLEHSYPSLMSRIKLENSGEKYYTSENPTTNFIKVYNPDHTLWKSIFLDIPFDFGSVGLRVDIISENKIAADSLLEIGYCYVYYSPLMYEEFYGKICNENGLTYLDTTGTQSYTLSVFPDLPNKLIELINFPDVFENTPNYKTSIYSIDATMGTSGFQKNSTIDVAPNPSNSVVNIASTTQIVEASIFNVLGAKVKDVKAQNLTKINVENLPSGMYLLTLLDINNQKSVHKITISH